MSREPSEINPEINEPAYDYTLGTRLTTSQEGRKRPHISSPEHRAEHRPVKKMNKRSGEVFQSSGFGIGTSAFEEETTRVQTSSPLAILPACEQISAAGLNAPFLSPPSISLSSPGNTRLLPTEQSDIQENSEYKSEFLSIMSRADQGLSELCENQVSKGQVRNDMGFFAESLRSVVGSPSQLSLKNGFGSEGTPDSCCAG